MRESADRRLLREMLSATHEVITATTPAGLDGDFDVCVVGESAYRQHEDALRTRGSEAEPAFLPFLLVVREGSGLRSSTDVWDTVDDVVSMPVPKPELRARLERLLRRRDQSRRLIERESRLQAALQDLRRNENAIASAPIGIVVIDATRADNPVVYANEAFEDLTGYPNEEIEGRNCRFLQGPETDPDALADLRRGIENAEPVTVELRNYRRDGTQFWNRVTVAPIRDEAGEVTNYVGFQEDVTEEKRRDLQLDAFDRVLRHNLHNEMNVILGAADTIAETAGDEMADYAGMIASSGRELLDITRKQREIVELLTEGPEVVSTDVSSLVRACADRVERAHEPGTVSVDVRADVRAAVIPQFDRAVTEIVENAIVHTDPATARVSVRTVPEGVRIRVADEGDGVPDPEQAILRGEGEGGPLYHGSGMGLWLVNWIVTYSGGSIEYAENESGGATVDLLVPEGTEA
jgi:PAS domain S-box-containing protein